MTNQEIVQAFANCNFDSKPSTTISIQTSLNGSYVLRSYAATIASFMDGVGFVLFPRARASATTSKHYSLLENTLIKDRVYYTVSPYADPTRCPKLRDYPNPRN